MEAGKFIIGTPKLLGERLKVEVEDKTGYYEIDFCTKLENIFTALDFLEYDFLASLDDSKLVFRKRS